MFKKLLKKLKITPDNGLVLQLFDPILNLAPVGVL